MRIEWGRPHRLATTSWPLVAIPPLGAGEPPGLIPYALPPGMPATMAAYPPPMGFPASRARRVDWNLYMDAMLRSSRKLGPDPAPGIVYHFNRAWSASASASTTTAEKQERERGEEGGKRGIPGLEGFDDVLTCLSACHTSRLQALRRAIVNTERSLLQQPDSSATTNASQSALSSTAASSSRIPLHPVRNGVVLDSVFVSQHHHHHQRRPCLVYAIAANESDIREPPVLGRDFRPFVGGNAVAARLSDIERCVLGQRLSLTHKGGLGPERFAGELRWAMWWRPEMGARARRPEAGHPLHCPPASILWIYSVLLHHVAMEPAAVTREEEEEEEEDAREEGEGRAGEEETQGEDNETHPDLAECLRGDKDAMYVSGGWYFDLPETGTCRLCRAPLVDALRRRFPDLLDDEGCVDVVILRDRGSVEQPEATIRARSHEIFV